MTPSVLGSRTFWIDVEDFFLYFAASPRPSGIQRLVFETVSVMPARAKLLPDAPRIAFVRHSGNAALLREVPFEAVARFSTGRTAWMPHRSRTWRRGRSARVNLWAGVCGCG